MDFISRIIDFILHVDVYLEQLITNYGMWTLAILFAVIFMETGLVVTPFLPGDSLIFAAGTFAARGALNPWVLFIVLSFVGVLGDTVNYWIGHTVGGRAYSGEVKWIKKDYMVRTHAFFEKYGGKAVVLARFVPIVRTFVPFVAGAASMSYPAFAFYNVTGGIAWVAICVGAGYAFGNVPVVKNNFSLVALGIVFVSVLPALVEYLRTRRGGAMATER